MKKTVLGILFVLGVFFIGYSAYTYYPLSQTQENRPDSIGHTTISGVLVCLPHKNPGPSTAECAYGVKTDEGKYYAFDLGSDPERLALFQVGERFEGSGRMVPVELLSTNHWQIYPIVGIFTPDITYSNSIQGISFSYPVGYVLTEQATNDEYTIVLTPQNSLPLPEAGEGPTTITIVVYGNKTAPMMLFDWVTKSKESNFNLSDGTYVADTIAGTEALRYFWSGLYEGETVVVKHTNSIIALTGTYITKTDQIVNDFKVVLATLKLH